MRASSPPESRAHSRVSSSASSTHGTVPGSPTAATIKTHHVVGKPDRLAAHSHARRVRALHGKVAASPAAGPVPSGDARTRSRSRASAVSAAAAAVAAGSLASSKGVSVAGRGGGGSGGDGVNGGGGGGGGNGGGTPVVASRGERRDCDGEVDGGRLSAEAPKFAADVGGPSSESRAAEHRVSREADPVTENVEDGTGAESEGESFVSEEGSDVSGGSTIVEVDASPSPLMDLDPTDEGVVDIADDQDEPDTEDRSDEEDNDVDDDHDMSDEVDDSSSLREAERAASTSCSRAGRPSCVSPTPSGPCESAGTQARSAAKHSSSDAESSRTGQGDASETATAADATTRMSKTTAILDWDDTICPSTHLASLGMRVDDAGSLPAPLQEQLGQLEAAVINIVREALRFGEVVVITNAEAGWVELSGRRFLPRVVDFLVEHNIKIVSARTTFECDFPDAPSSWKVAAFSQEVATMYPDEDELNILVLGDSMSERDAAHALGARMPQSKLKTVKFVERPSIDQLMRQVQLVAQSLPDLASYSSSFDVDLVVSASS